MRTSSSHARMDGQGWGLLMQEPARGTVSLAKRQREGMGSGYKYITREGRGAVEAKGCCWCDNGWDKLAVGMESLLSAAPRGYSESVPSMGSAGVPLG